MARRVCPWWLGYWLLNPLRRLTEDSARVVGPWVREGMTVLEPGSGMGYFTLEIARRVGERGRVIAIDLQERMLRRLRRRVASAGLSGRVEARLAGAERLGLDDLIGAVDLCLAIHVVHEVPSARDFFAEVHAALRPDGLAVVIEPRHHVTAEELEREVAAAVAAGLEVVAPPAPAGARSTVLRRP